MAPNDLTTLDHAKLWLTTPNSASDKFLSLLISSLSRQILGHMQTTTLLSRTVTEVYDGNGSHTFALRQRPVTGVSQVLVNNQVIPFITADTGSNSPFSGLTPPWGYRFNAWDGIPPAPACFLRGLQGLRFWEGYQNISITYTAGYLISNEAWAVPQGANPADQITVLQPHGTWAGDNGVTYANGTPLTAVAAAPAQHQYCISSPGVYQFNTADELQNVLISYSFTPAAVEQVVMEMMNEVIARRQRPGVKSQNLSGINAATYSSGGLPAWAVEALEPYTPKIPV